MSRRPYLAACAASVAWLVVAACSATTPRESADPPTSTSALAPIGAPTTTSIPVPTVPTTVPRERRRFTIAASGDVLLHNPVIQSGRRNAGGEGFDFGPMFDDVRETLSEADLALCHQETPISADDRALTVPNTLSFNAPRAIAPALRDAGFDGCDTASNHVWDRGLDGVHSTLDVLDAAGLRHAGMSRDDNEARTPPIYEINGVKVGHLAFTYAIFNEARPSQSVPAEAPWLEAMLWPRIGVEGVLLQAQSIKARGAEFVIVSMHWGNQYVRQPTSDQLAYARALLASPYIDLILGAHAHVVQPCEKLNGKYVAYGMGNFLSNQSPTQDASLRNENQDGVIVRFTVEERVEGGFVTERMHVVPTWVVIPRHRIERATREVHADSYARTLDAMHSLGPGTCDASPTG